MKTTFELPDDLVVEAKKLAAEERRPLRELVEDGLRRVLREPQARELREPRIRWVVAKGGVPPETASRDRMAKWLERPR